MWGGPAHYVAPLNATIETNVSGIRIGELLPLLVNRPTSMPSSAA